MIRDSAAAAAVASLEIRFRGKSGKSRHVHLDDPVLARLTASLQDLPGQRLFQYIDDGGEVLGVESGDVNEYLRAATGSDITSKDFRTWTATVSAATALHEAGEASSRTAGKRTVSEAIKHTAARLGNTPAVCRRSYVHPIVVEAYLDNRLCPTLDACYETARSSKPRELLLDEAAVLELLEQEQGLAAIAAK